jgi:hypothetical protein
VRLEVNRGSLSSMLGLDFELIQVCTLLEQFCCLNFDIGEEL